MGQVVDFTGQTVADIEPAKVAEGAKELESILVLGWDKNGEFYIASSSGEIGELLILVELGRRSILDRLEADD